MTRGAPAFSVYSMRLPSALLYRVDARAAEKDISIDDYIAALIELDFKRG